ncbi:hypothetical protein LPJ66_000609 [Kickxella alabastrina]|uniref:Uncharacterized protein n=1 Tax=Kickxella alabastrina TaxID=61397 RepID=A0ACC1IVK5_9FUNG|nr:hypothetical protein LPJ66_000609 [Kickxella alabastrina]
MSFLFSIAAFGRRLATKALLTLLALLVLSRLALGQDRTRLKCHSLPHAAGIVLRAYDNADIIDIDCETTTNSRVGNTTVWHRTVDGCYVSNFYFYVPKDDRIPQCTLLDSKSSCELPNLESLEIIQKYEQEVVTPRNDVNGKTVLGFGHRCASPGCGELSLKFPIGQRKAQAVLLLDMSLATSCLKNAINERIVLGDNQWGALASWVYDIGCPAAAKSKLITRLNAGEEPNDVAAEELPLWNTGRVSAAPKYAERRAAEVKLFLAESIKVAHPRCTSFLRLKE